MAYKKMGWPKEIDPQDEELVFELYDIHGMRPKQIAEKFEIDAGFLLEWLKQRIYKSKRGSL